MFENRHFDYKRKSWYLGTDAKARQIVDDSIKSFYEKLTTVMMLSEKIRELNDQFTAIKDISEVNGATADEVHNQITKPRNPEQQLSGQKRSNLLNNSKKKSRSSSHGLSNSQ